MRNFIYLLMLLVMTGCHKRYFDNDVDCLIMAPIKIDWSKSNLNTKDISRVTVRVFPDNGNPAYDFVMQSDINKDIMPISVGKYSLVIFNETTEPNDWSAMTFKGADKYSTFEVGTKDDTFNGLYRKTEGDKIRKSPERIAAWSIDELEVTPEMRNYAPTKGENAKTRTSSSIAKIEAQMSKLTTITPLPLVKKLNIEARIANLTSAQKSSGSIKGVAGSVRMSNKKAIETGVTHIFIMNGRQYDNPANPKDGTLRATLFIFGAMQDGFTCMLNLDFLLTDGEMFPTQTFDITQQVDVPENEINIKLGCDNLISLPAKPISNGSVSVDDWGDVVIPLK